MMDPDAYCREIEGHLCRKNEGHLVRIVGPAFEVVSGWAARGIPLKVALAGIDRFVERYYAKGPRRRPVRIEHCEADVLDVFDRWRRAVGVTTTPSGDAAEPEAPRAGRSLPAHLDRVVMRLTSCRAGGRLPEAVDRQIEQLVRDLDTMRAGVRGSRGEARAALVARLDQWDQDVMDAAVAGAEEAVIAEIDREAAAELEPFRARMSAAAWERAVDRARRRLLRERFGIPSIGFE